MKTTGKTELVSLIAAKSVASKETVATILDDAIAIILSEANAGNTVNLKGFGKFEVKERAARTGRNPATGAPVEIPASRKLSFKASSNALS